MENYNFIAENDENNIRIDLYLSNEIENISRSRIQKLIDNQNITVNGNHINKNYKIKTGDIIDVFVPDAVELDIKPENIDLDIIYEDNSVIVINKKKGMVVHPAPGHYSGTLVNALLYHCKGNLSGINGILRPGIVHRIDKDTSGILVVAKNDMAHKFLASQLAQHSMTRIYNAIVFNNLKQDSGTINCPIGRHHIERKKMSVTNKNSKQAITHYKVIERFGKFNLIELKLETGRTHQIRVHMSFIGYPLLGDTVYGSKKQPFNLNGQALHAKVLGFIHPETKEYMEFESELPEYFQNLISILKNNKY